MFVAQMAKLEREKRKAKHNSVALQAPKGPKQSGISEQNDKLGRSGRIRQKANVWLIEGKKMRGQPESVRMTPDTVTSLLKKRWACLILSQRKKMSKTESEWVL